MPKNNVRFVALDLIIRIEKEGSFSHLLISQAIQCEKLGLQDERLLTEIVYGTIERKLTLDYYLKPFIRSPKKVADWVMNLLRMSVFQLEFLDKVPEYAVIHEAVEIAKQKGHKGIASFVNGVLRNIVRKGVPNTNEITDPIEKISIETSHPFWLVKRWVDQYGLKVTKEMCETNLLKKPVSLRVNQLRISREAAIEHLQNEAITAQISPYVKDGIIIQQGNILKTTLLSDGLVSVQDQSSMLASIALQVEPDFNVLDACSAPGGKATYIGELMENKGTIHAYDLHKNKLTLIEENAKRLGLTNIKVGQSDARKLQEIHQRESFDRILIDAPCSGLGVIRSKPDIKYNKRVEDIYKLHEVQTSILEHVAPLLKKGGKLVYSTCTVDKQENEAVVQAFLHENKNFTIDESFKEEIKDLMPNLYFTKFGLQLFPQTIQSDGFFMTRLIKMDHY
ncbi:16S rRNA (cytosine(967)-C(5))-methyltransferase RsmB [Pseudogracilibacillus sp. SO30301A]|uniref:16S rRNA (cytosine(967)-C(5))-methyltransferase RsmB n=1 Tax=Pseudogracilibacillus sp. SO30301A TaxID=3098291 RepID=UPI00300E3E2C